MPDPVLIDKQLFLHERFTPAAVNWSRLEGRPRREDFARSLAAEVRDPLWMISRQWQFGEFRGENTGSAIDAKVQVEVGRVDTYAPTNDGARPYDDVIPLEVRVEREPIPMSLHVRVQIGRHFIRPLGALWNGDIRAAYLSRYPIEASTNPEKAAHLASDTNARAFFSAVAGRLPDGARLLDDIRGGGHDAFVTGLAIADADREALRRAASALTAWFARVYSVPGEGEPMPWQPPRLEYRFACGAPSSGDAQGRLTLAASAYPGTGLDWYAFDADRGTQLVPAPGESLPEPQIIQHAPRSYLPAPIEYAGMPNVRFWQFEDRKTNFGDIRASTTDLALLILAEFALIYGNDWILVPYELPVASFAAVRGVIVTDVFGVRTFVRPAGSRLIDSWQHWNMFNLEDPSSRSLNTHLLLLPTLGHREEGAPIEAVTFTRDEMANMVFAIEETIPGEIGTGTGGDEVAAALERHLRANAPPDTTTLQDTGATVRYVAGTTVPENWIPFVPVQVSAISGDIRLQRGRMARIIRGAPTPTVAPRGDILREGLDRTPQDSYFIEEEEVPSGGTKVVRAFHRARWYDGRVYVWLGRRKVPGRGEGESGLRFDQVEPLIPSTSS
jgi:hypothetical protein